MWFRCEVRLSTPCKKRRDARQLFMSSLEPANGSAVMNKILRVASVGIVLLACALFAVAQTDSKSANKLTDKAITATERTNGAVPTVGSAASEEFVIGTGDVLAINVWKEPE